MLNKNTSRFDFLIYRAKRLKSNRSAATSLTIGLIVMLTIALVLFALYTFLTNKNASNTLIYQDFEDVYAKEAQINFFLSHGGSLNDISKLNEENMVIKVEGQEIVIEKAYTDNKNKIMTVVYRFKPET